MILILSLTLVQFLHCSQWDGPVGQSNGTVLRNETEYVQTKKDGVFFENNKIHKNIWKHLKANWYQTEIILDLNIKTISVIKSSV